MVPKCCHILVCFLFIILNAVNPESPLNSGLYSIERESGQIEVQTFNLLENEPTKKVVPENNQNLTDTSPLLITRNQQVTSYPQNINDRSQFYVIAAIFNPASFLKRYELYHEFAKYMEESEVNLITIECIFPTLNQTEFQVTQANNSFHIQLTSPSIYWVKENLINIAVSRLPPAAKWVAWIDADVYFQEKDWVEHTISALQKYSVVQLFEYANFLDADNNVLIREYSFGYSIVSNITIKSLNGEDPHPGYAWAMSRTTFESVGGLPEYDIIGMLDLYFAYSLINKVGTIIQPEFGCDYMQGVILKSEEVYQKLKMITHEENKEGIVGYAPLVLNHKWHGPRKNRQYVARTRILKLYNFNFYTSMTKNDNGLLEFVGNGKDSIQNDIACYFQARNEDSKDDTDTVGFTQKCSNYESLVDTYNWENRFVENNDSNYYYYALHRYSNHSLCNVNSI